MADFCGSTSALLVDGDHGYGRVKRRDWSVLGDVTVCRMGCEGRIPRRRAVRSKLEPRKGWAKHFRETAITGDLTSAARPTVSTGRPEFPCPFCTLECWPCRNRVFKRWWGGSNLRRSPVDIGSQTSCCATYKTNIRPQRRAHFSICPYLTRGSLSGSALGNEAEHCFQLRSGLQEMLLANKTKELVIST